MVGERKWVREGIEKWGKEGREEKVDKKEKQRVRSESRPYAVADGDDQFLFLNILGIHVNSLHYFLPFPFSI